MRWCCFAIGLGLTVDFTARAGLGLVETLDGRTLIGELQLSNNVLTVLSTNPASTVVALTNLQAAKFSAPGEIPGGGAGGSGNGLLGYYCSNTQLVGHVAVRLDETIDFDWQTTPPAPGVIADR